MQSAACRHARLMAVQPGALAQLCPCLRLKAGQAAWGWGRRRCRWWYPPGGPCAPKAVQNVQGKGKQKSIGIGALISVSASSWGWAFLGVLGQCECGGSQASLHGAAACCSPMYNQK